MDDLLELFPVGTSVSTPVGRAVVTGYVFRGSGKKNVIVSTDARPMSIFDDSGSCILHAWAYPPEELKIIENTPLIMLGFWGDHE